MHSILLVHLLFSAWSLTCAYQVNEKEPLPPKAPLRPGDLLRSLDELTSDAEVIYKPIAPAPATSRVADRRAYDEDSSESEDATEYDYDKAYEDFVNKYFAQGEHDLEPEEEEEKSFNDDNAAAFDTPSEDESDDPGPKKKRSKSKICERVQIDGQNCVVCEDPSSNEKSKSCSYSSEPEARSYGYSKEKSTSRSNGDEDDDDDADEAAETARSLKREATSGNDRLQPRRTTTPLSAAGSSKNENALKCARRREDGMICFYCGTPSSNTRECIADKNSPKKARLDESSKKDSKSKKIFKRMVTYSYKSHGKPKVEEKTFAALEGY